jgi:hypothetical protein
MYAQATTVPVGKTRAEIEALLERHKARQYGTAVDYDQRRALVNFRLHDRIVRFSIELPDQRKMNASRYGQAERQRWRALLLVIKAKLESVENQIEAFEQAFLAQIVMPNNVTVGDLVHPMVLEAYKSGRMPAGLLPASTEAAD